MIPEGISEVVGNEKSARPNLTLFAIPKPFEGHIATIQENALCSWSLLAPGLRVILFGDDAGTAQAAARYRFKHVSEVACNEHGTPLVSDLFAQAQDIADTSLVCYVNADIVLMSDFLTAARAADNKFAEFLMIGQRWDVDVREAWDFGAPDWQDGLRKLVRQRGNLEDPTGIDYFLFPRGMYACVPPFAIGRGTWDNWLVYQSRARGIPVVDATSAVMVVHQNHGYAPNTLDKTKAGWKILGPEYHQNMALAGKGGSGFYNVWEATWVLDPEEGLRRQALTLSYIKRRLVVLAIRYLGMRSLFRMVARVWAWLFDRQLVWYS